MSVEIIRHVFDKQRCLEIVDIQDSHGRTHQIQAPMQDADAFIDKEISAFAELEDRITSHIEARFNPETLERKQP
jgi:hypothetical protein